MRTRTLSTIALCVLLKGTAARISNESKRRNLRATAANRLSPPFLEAEPPRWSRDDESNNGNLPNLRVPGRETDRIPDPNHGRDNRNATANSPDEETEYDPDDGRPFDFDQIQMPSKQPSPMPSPSPSDQFQMPSKQPSSMASPSPSDRPSVQPSIDTASRVDDVPPPERAEICPLNQPSSGEQWHIEIHPDSNMLDDIEDDLAEISSMVFSGQTDAEGNRYAYAASDKAQFSVKVIQFSASLKSGKVVATYKLDNVDTKNDDWEDMSLGPCSGDLADTTTCIYIGNFGNNERPDYKVRKELEIFKFPEPVFAGSLPTSQTVDVATISYKYEDTKPLDGTCSAGVLVTVAALV